MRSTKKLPKKYEISETNTEWISIDFNSHSSKKTRCSSFFCRVPFSVVKKTIRVFPKIVFFFPPKPSISIGFSMKIAPSILGGKIHPFLRLTEMLVEKTCHIHLCHTWWDFSRKKGPKTAGDFPNGILDC